MSLPLEQLLRALQAEGGADPQIAEVGDYARVDLGREHRKGMPEVVFAAGKSPEQVIEICRRFLSTSDRVIVSRAAAQVRDAIHLSFENDYAVEQSSSGQTLVVRRPGTRPQTTGGRVAIITAGTSDVPYAEEAGIVAAEMGCHVAAVADVGVAGLHRLFGPLRQMFADGVDVVVVAAGMDGALPSVVAGLVPVPVIGLPTPIGYGYGGEGVGALMNMLQTCAPGLAVVNIGNGVGAGAMAALIANQVARARGSTEAG